MTASVSLDTATRLHQLATAFHVFIYFAPEATESYEEEGIGDRAGYFASRTAAMGPVPADMVISTFYNFEPDLVRSMMDGVWTKVSADAMQLARWRAVVEVLDQTCRKVLTAEEVHDAVAIAQDVVDSLPWAGRPLAAGNAAALHLLDSSDMSGDELLRLWQLLTVIREWRGDTHVALLMTEPLDGTECTVVTHARQGGFTKASRSWPEDKWDAAVARLVERGWLVDEDTLTEQGSNDRQRLEDRTSALSAVMWDAIDESSGERLVKLLEPLVDAIAQAGYLKPVGIRPRDPEPEPA